MTTQKSQTPVQQPGKTNDPGTANKGKSPEQKDNRTTVETADQEDVDNQDPNAQPRSRRESNDPSKVDRTGEQEKENDPTRIRPESDPKRKDPTRVDE